MALTVEQLEILGAALADVYQQLERAAIADIARRLRKTERLTETAELMAEALRQKGYSPIAIQRQVMRELNANPYFQQEIAANTLAYKQTLQKQIDAAKESARRVGREVVQEAGNLAFRNDLSMWAQGAKPVKGSAFERLIQATKKALTADLLNLTRTTGFQLPTGAMVSARNAYTRALNLALVKTTSGAYSYRQAIAEAVRELAASGLRTVDYASGVSRQLDAAARNAVMTASAQLAGQITMDNAEQTGVDYVEVSSHWGARTGEGHANHAAWQGKIYRIHGSDEKYGNLERETGYPSDPAGLCGYNCRHTFSPFWPGISEPTQWPKEPEPKEYGGRSYTYYQATQAQRRREREIRALKREADGMKAAGLTQPARQLEGRIRAMTEEYEDFSAAMEIRPKNERLWVCEGNNLPTEMFRKTKNIGVFAMLPERMSKKHIREIAKEFGISLKGVRIVIDADEEKLKPTFFYAGRADPQEIGRIDFFPQAFLKKEELTRTLFHEKIHVEQFKEFGAEYVQNHRAYFEKLARLAEEEFIERMKREGRL